jgi:glycosyltransferase involved in cell wall biosynthesis
MKIRALITGPNAITGGVAIHYRAIVKHLRRLPQLEVLSYDVIKPGDSVIHKAYRRTLGFLLYFMKKRREIDLIHVNSCGGLFGFLDTITAVFLSRLYEKRLVITFHYSGTKSFLKKYELIVCPVFNRADKIIFVSSKQKEALLSLKKNKQDPVVIPNGYSEEEIYPVPVEIARARLNIPLNRRVLLSIGNLEEYKGHKYLIQAMKKVVERYPDAVLYIVGKGSLEGELRSLSQTLGLEGHVILAGGGKPREEIPLWINACDVFVLPSLHESFGIVQIEAMACGKPVVATRNGGSEDIVVNSDIGMLIEPANVDALADAIATAIRRKWDAYTIIQYSRRFRWGVIAERIFAVYNSCDAHNFHDSN